MSHPLAFETDWVVAAAMVRCLSDKPFDGDHTKIVKMK